MSGADQSAALQAYAATFERLHSTGVGELAKHLAADVRFKDPFNDVRGIEACLGVFRHMYATLIEPRFQVRHQAVGDGIGYLHWTLGFRGSAEGRPRRIEGLSQVCFDARGRVVTHIDYWDPAEQLYADVPVLGWVLGRVRSRLSAGAKP